MVPVQDTSRNTRRTIAFLVVVGVHVVMIWGLNSGLTDIIKEKVLGTIQTVEIAAPKEEEAPPPPPPPRPDVEPPPFVPPPDFVIETAPPETTAIQAPTTQVRPTEPPPAPAPRQKVTVQPKPGRNGLSLPEYPPSERRAEHTGTVYLQVLVLENGRVGDARVQTSSGYPKLDEAAVAHAKRDWRFTAGTEDGKGVQMWVTVPVVFKLN